MVFEVRVFTAHVNEVRSSLALSSKVYDPDVPGKEVDLRQLPLTTFLGEGQTTVALDPPDADTLTNSERPSAPSGAAV